MENLLDGQQKHWEHTYSEDPNLFGEEPGYAQKAAGLFRTGHKDNILDLGYGHTAETQSSSHKTGSQFARWITVRQEFKRWLERPRL